MNKVFLMGRLTRDPEVRYSNQGDRQLAIARYTLAVDRRFKRNGDESADFISCVVFDRQAEFAEKYLRKGTKLVVTGRLQTGSYTNRDGVKVYTTDVIVEDQEFAESKSATAEENTASANNQDNQRGTNNPQYGGQPAGQVYNGNSYGGNDFMNIPDGVEDEGLPFN